MINKWLDKDLCSAIDEFSKQFSIDNNYDGRGSKSMSHKVLAQVIVSNVLPKMELDKKGGKDGFKIKMF